MTRNQLVEFGVEIVKDGTGLPQFDSFSYKKAKLHIPAMELKNLTIRELLELVFLAGREYQVHQIHTALRLPGRGEMESE